MRVRIYFFCIAIFFNITGLIPVNGQVFVQRSDEKTVISGEQYYLHTVKKGETSYSISRAYNVSVEELAKNNPQVVYSVREGETLIIPYRELAENVDTGGADNEMETRDESRYSYHILQSGETVYSLSKIYGVSENEILSANPDIDVTNLSIGMELAIPVRDFKIETQTFAEQDTSYFFHKVQRGESLSSIAGIYGIPLRILRRENRNVRFPSEGDIVRIPSEYLELTDVTGILPDSIQLLEDIYTDRIISEEYSIISRLEGTVDVAVLLPFYLDENRIRYDIDSSRFLNGERTYITEMRKEEWIYSRSMGFVEMYQGILVAADTLRNLGMNINIHTYDITSDTIEISRLISMGILDDMDLIIGPVYSANLEIVAEYASKRDIPVVSPVQLLSDELLEGNPTLFVANPFLDVSQDYITMAVAERYRGNVVFIHSDTSGSDNEVTSFKNKILYELEKEIPYDQIRFKEFLFYSRSAFNNDSINRLGHALSPNLDNVLVIASEDGSVISETLQEIHTLSRSCSVRVFSYPFVRSMSNLEPKYLFDLELSLFSPFWIDYSKEDVRIFVNSFYSKWLQEPDEMSYAWSGYDIAYYFISGLSLYGREFLLHPGIHNPDLLHTRFDFRRENNRYGFENYGLYPIRYTKDYDVVLEDFR